LLRLALKGELSPTTNWPTKGELSPTINWPTKGELSPTTNWPTKGEQLFLASLSTTDTEKSRQLPKKSDFLEKSDFSNLWKNRISQTVCPNVPKKSGAQEIRCPKNPLPNID
jgi:hypothetical protein